MAEKMVSFASLKVGAKGEISKKITAKDIEQFAALSLDTNPIHLNEEFASQTMFKGRIAHGMLTASLISAAVGTKMPGPGGKKTEEIGFCAHAKLAGLVGKNKAVLDVGCGRGALAEKLSANGCRVIGIEYSKELAAEAAEMCEDVLVGDAQSMDLKLKPESFDVLLFADVLEHLREPGAVLQKTRPLLKKNGEIIVSVPNIANWRIRLNLLLGRFDYAEQGIMDRTHVHFYTLKTARELVERNGYSIKKIGTVPSFPFPNPLRARAVGRMKQFFSGVFPGLFSFQFLVVAELVEKKEEKRHVTVKTAGCNQNGEVVPKRKSIHRG